MANASLLKMLKDAPCIEGIVDDIEQLPFPTVMFKQTGEVDSYHSNTFPDLAQMIGDEAELEPHRVYAFVLRWRRGVEDGHLAMRWRSNASVYGLLAVNNSSKECNSADCQHSG